MLTRRHFLEVSSGAVLGMASKPDSGRADPQKNSGIRRIPPQKRKFRSDSVDATIDDMKRSIQDPELAALFENCYPNTLDTTVRHRNYQGKPDTFIITGDINAMWLRDSSAQVWPYVPLSRQDPDLKVLLAGVINRQTRCILIDPYANAFNLNATGSPWAKDRTAMKPELHERKWEVDSLCYPIRLAYKYWKTTGDGGCFDADWQAAMKRVLETFREQQRLHGPGPYRFERVTATAVDTLPGEGLGNPTRPCGMVHSAFRPSDDACIFPFLIPSNLFAIVSLTQLAEILETEVSNPSMAGQCRELSQQIGEAVSRYGTSEHGRHGKVYAYEVDGFGNQLFMDDANIPSLLSLPYLGCCSLDDVVYQNTRRLVLSPDNPYFFRGTAGEGIGGPHVGLGMIWPLAIVARAITASDREEIRLCLAMLKNSHAGTGFMHEAFSRDNPAKYTRAWFAWANSFFGELILKLHHENPDLLRSG